MAEHAVCLSLQCCDCVFVCGRVCVCVCVCVCETVYLPHESAKQSTKPQFWRFHKEKSQRHSNKSCPKSDDVEKFCDPLTMKNKIFAWPIYFASPRFHGERHETATRPPTSIKTKKYTDVLADHSKIRCNRLQRNIMRDKKQRGLPN
jgi:hypothetical protein